MKLHCTRIARCRLSRDGLNEAQADDQELHFRQAVIARAPRMPSWKHAKREIGSGQVGRLGFAGLAERDFAQEMHFADTDVRRSRRPV